ncbi:MAG: radical SAM protein [Chloroflexota bacterium]
MGIIDIQKKIFQPPFDKLRGQLENLFLKDYISGFYTMTDTDSEIAANSATEPRPPSRALTPTGGYLTGFTYSLQPYIGCKFSCPYCYVQGLSVHRFHKPQLPWGEYAHPRIGIGDLLGKELARHYKRQIQNQLSIFMSSSTDPYQGLERRWKLSRTCLEAMVEYPPHFLMLQTRSPLVERDFDLLVKLEDRVWLSITIETDSDDVRQIVTPRCPSIDRRFETVRKAQEMGLNVQIAVSPCLPYSSVEAFAQRLVTHAQRIVIDTYASGDGQQGKRTARTQIPKLYETQQWPRWDAEEAGQELYQWLRKSHEQHVGWSQQGFTALSRSAS